MSAQLFVLGMTSNAIPPPNAIAPAIGGARNREDDGEHCFLVSFCSISMLPICI
ncbi:MAG TPA: hypothetical protein VEV17_19715 [Bryobacteraceae bacterium]|nr:hypothetical protein [Bryobacteraceae bacterium]